MAISRENTNRNGTRISKPKFFKWCRKIPNGKVSKACFATSKKYGCTRVGDPAGPRFPAVAGFASHFVGKADFGQGSCRCGLFVSRPFPSVSGCGDLLQTRHGKPASWRGERTWSTGEAEKCRDRVHCRQLSSKTLSWFSCERTEKNTPFQLIFQQPLCPPLPRCYSASGIGFDKLAHSGEVSRNIELLGGA